MENDKPKSRKIPWTTWIATFLVAGLVAVFIGFVYLWVLNARNQAMRTQSANNLKQIGLAIHNYHDTMKRLPMGGILSPKGRPMHGWSTMILPFLEASSLYDSIDQNYSWDDPLNQHVYRFSHWTHNNPIIKTEYSSNGYALTHYSLNQSIFNYGPPLRLEELPGGTTNSWMGIELFAQWHPWGSASNFCELKWPPPADPRQATWLKGGCNILMADGSIVYLDQQTDLEKINDLKKYNPTVDSKFISDTQPEFRFRNHRWTADRFVMPVRGNIETVVRTLKNKDGLCSFVQVISEKASLRTKADQPVASTHEELAFAIDREPSMESLKIKISLDDSSVAKLTRLERLEYLEIGEFELSEHGLKQLTKLKAIKMLACRCSRTDQALLQRSLPDCEIRSFSDR